jgi:photoactive yellow protein
VRIVKFGSNNIANDLASLSSADLDELAFGVVELDRRGIIVSYNAAEAQISGRAKNDMLGRDFFADVAPCTRGEAFEGRFRAGVAAGKLDVQFTYVLDHEMAPTEVRVRMSRAEGRDTYWVLIKRVLWPVVQ